MLEVCCIHHRNRRFRTCGAAVLAGGGESREQDRFDLQLVVRARVDTPMPATANYRTTRCAALNSRVTQLLMPRLEAVSHAVELRRHAQEHIAGGTTVPGFATDAPPLVAPPNSLR